LYDAVLLAESVYLPRESLERSLRKGRPVALTPNANVLLARWERADLDDFLKEYPWVTGGMTAWQTRLAGALAPTFATCEQPAFSKVDVPAWRTSDVLGLARAIEDRDVYDRLPVLADALEEAGCDDGDVLDHCRAGHLHGHDCWVTAWLLRSGDGSHTGLA